MGRLRQVLKYNELKSKLNGKHKDIKYKVVEEKAVVGHIRLEVSFVYKGKYYEAVGNIFSGRRWSSVINSGVDEIEVIWNDGEVMHYLDTEHPAFDIAVALLDTMETNLENMELNKETLKIF